MKLFSFLVLAAVLQLALLGAPSVADADDFYIPPATIAVLDDVKVYEPGPYSWWIIFERNLGWYLFD